MVKHLGADSSRKLLLGLKGQEDGEKGAKRKARLGTPGPIARQDLPLAEPNGN